MRYIPFALSFLWLTPSTALFAAAPIPPAQAEHRVHPMRRPALERDELRRTSGLEDAAHRPPGQRRRAVREHVLHHVALLAQPRVSILTGLYAHSHGVRDNFTELPAHLTHWPMRLREAGYETAYLGKWHMGENNDAPRPGFDYFATHKGQGKYFDTEWNVNGAGAKRIRGYYTTIVTDLALDWLRRDHAGKPWALCLGHKAPHSFYTPEEKYAHMLRLGARAVSGHGVSPGGQTGLDQGNGSTPGTASTARCLSGARSSPTIGPKR